MTLAAMTGLHGLAATLWVGGMFFAYVCLRPAMGGLEPPPERLKLWRGVFQKFFPWVWVSVLTLLVTGYWIIFVEWGGFAGAGPHVHIMQLTGLLMMALFAHLFFAEWKKFARMVDAEEFSDAATRLGRIRMIVLTNLIIGGVTVLIGASGRYWV